MCKTPMRLWRESSDGIQMHESIYKAAMELNAKSPKKRATRITNALYNAGVRSMDELDRAFCSYNNLTRIDYIGFDSARIVREAAACWMKIGKYRESEETMAKKYFCDLCGKEIEKSTYGSSNSLTFNKRKCEMFFTFHFDYCNNCMDVIKKKIRYAVDRTIKEVTPEEVVLEEEVKYDRDK